MGKFERQRPNGWYEVEIQKPGGAPHERVWAVLGWENGKWISADGRDIQFLGTVEKPHILELRYGYEDPGTNLHSW